MVLIFLDIVVALEQVGRDLVALKDITKNERQYYCDVIHDTYTVLDEAINIVRIRLGDLLLIEDRDVFVRELRGLDNIHEWMRIEREVLLCSKLSDTDREMRGLWSRFMRRFSVHNQRALVTIVSSILGGESELAKFINNSLSRLASLADEADQSSEGYKRAKEEVRETKNALSEEHEKLISSESWFKEEIRRRH